tara:strand:- start:319 stop:525 length:207 start_codon:yes stop_codon:yes gene_type:complete
MTSAECIKEIALKAYNSGLVTESDVKRMINPKKNKVSYRGYYRVMRFLNGISKGASGTDDRILWGDDA